MRRTILRNIENIKTSNAPVRGIYRCRITINGTRHECYETNLARAKNWVNYMKATNLKKLG